MKRRLWLFSIVAFTLLLATPQASQAQLKGLLNKVKKKDKNASTSSSDPVKALSGIPKVTEEDNKKAEELAEAFYERAVVNYSFIEKERYFENFWEPNTAAQHVNKANQELQQLASKDVFKFYEENKADIERYNKMAAALSKGDMSARNSQVYKIWYDDGYTGYQHKGAKALKAFNELKTEKFLELTQKFWDRENDTSSGNPVTGLKQAADYFIEVAYEYKEKDKGGAIRLMQSTIKAFDLFKQILPEGSSISGQMTTLENDLKATLKELGGKELANAMAGDFHKANVGKILFSKNPIDVKNAKDTDFSTDFSINDNIYGVLLLEESMELMQVVEPKAQQDFYEGQRILVPANITLQLEINDDYIKLRDFKNVSEKANQAYLTFAIKPAELKPLESGIFREFVKMIADKSPRTHTFEFKFTDPKDRSYGSPVLAQGKMSLSLSGMDKAKLQADSEKLLEANLASMEDALIEQRGLPEMFNDPKLYDHNFQPVSMAQVKQLALQVAKNHGGVKVDGIVVQDGNYNQTTWEVKVNALGTPVSRSGPVYFFAFTDQEGKCFHYIFSIYQKYLGNGKYSDTRFGNSYSANPTQYNCANKKFAR